MLNMKGVVFVIALVLAASLASAGGSVTTLKFTSDGKINGEPAQYSPHLNRVAGVERAVDSIECVHVLSNYEHPWRCYIPKETSVLLGAYNIICDENKDKTAYLSTCTIEYELLPSSVGIRARKMHNIRQEEKQTENGVEKNNDYYNLTDFVWHIIASGVLLLMWGLIAKKYDELNLGQVSFIESSRTLRCAIYKKLKTLLKMLFLMEDRCPIPFMCLVPFNLDAIHDDNLDAAPCDHAAIHSLRIEHPERYPQLTLLCRSCNKRVRLVDLYEDRFAPTCVYHGSSRRVLREPVDTHILRYTTQPPSDDVITF